MDYMSNKALIIAVSLIVTMTIASAVLYTVNQVTGIYKNVYETDTLIQSNFDEFDAYDKTVKTKLDLVNVAKKYQDSTSVFVTNLPQSDLGATTEEKKKKAKDSKINVQELEALLIEEDTNNAKAHIKDQSSANEKYNTYIEKLDDGSVIIGFVAQ